MRLCQYITILFLVMLPVFAGAHLLDKLGAGFTTGYRFNNTSIYLEYYEKQVVCNFEYIQNKYQNLGYSAGACYKTTAFKKYLEVGIGAYYAHLGGGTSATEWHDQGVTKNTTFYVDDANYLIPAIMIRANAVADDNSIEFERKARVSVFVRLGYRILISSDPGVRYVTGDEYPEQKRKMERAVKQGLGVSAGIAITIGKKHKK